MHQAGSSTEPRPIRKRQRRVRAGVALVLGGMFGAAATQAQDPATEAPIVAPPPQATSAAAVAPEPGLTPLAAELAAWGPTELLDDSVSPGESRQLALVVSASLAGVDVATPVFVHRGVAPGPALCLTAGIHGDEVNGVEVVRRVISRVDASELSGTLISVPIVNVSAVRRGSRYLPDRRDLNRYFPGHPHGSAASRIAYRFFDKVMSHCEALVDIHTGSFHRSNLHQLRADLRRPQVLDMARGLGSQIVVHNTGRTGTLRGAAVAAGIPAVTIEGGEPARLSIPEVELGVTSILRLLDHLGMRADGPDVEGRPRQEFYDRGHWIRASVGGILVSRVELGQRVRQGQELGTITDPLSSREDRIVAPAAGRIVGMAFDQLVMPGFATFHVAVREAPPSATPPTGLNLDPGEEQPLEDTGLDERPE